MGTNSWINKIIGVALLVCIITGAAGWKWYRNRTTDLLRSASQVMMDDLIAEFRPQIKKHHENNLALDTAKQETAKLEEAKKQEDR